MFGEGFTSLDSDKDMIIGRQQGAGAGGVQGVGPKGSWEAGLVDSRRRRNVSEEAWRRPASPLGP